MPVPGPVNPVSIFRTVPSFPIKIVVGNILMGVISGSVFSVRKESLVFAPVINIGYCTLNLCLNFERLFFDRSRSSLYS